MRHAGRVRERAVQAIATHVVLAVGQQAALDTHRKQALHSSHNDGARLAGFLLDSLDAGVPMFDLDRKSLISRALLDLNGRTGGTPQSDGRSFLGRTLPMFKRSHT